MRTSASQFQILVDYMERNGDLSKPSDLPNGKTNNARHWTTLANMLNADATGDSKSVIKWRKVWSDLKNNTKKKASKIYQAAKKTGGGPASNLKLTDLEQRVLSIVGTQAATGIEQIPEVGLEEVFGANQEDDSPSIFQINDLIQQQTCSNIDSSDWNRPGTSSQPSVFPLLLSTAGEQETEILTNSVDRAQASESAVGSRAGRKRPAVATTSARQHALSPQNPTPSPQIPASPPQLPASPSQIPASPTQNPTPAPQNPTPAPQNPTPLPRTPRRQRRHQALKRSQIWQGRLLSDLTLNGAISRWRRSAKE